MKLTIIIPLYNETGLICSTLDRLLKVEMPSFIEWKEIIVIDDCSTDDSYNKVADFIKPHSGIKILRHERNMGKGAAVMTGAGAAEGDVLLIQDADLELDPSDIPALVTNMHEHNLAFVSGSRFMTTGSGHYNRRMTTIANKTFSRLASIMSGRKITDLTCGYKVIRKEFFDRLALHENRFGFETELMIKSLGDHEVSFAETPVSYVPRDKTAGKKIRTSDGIHILMKIIRYGLKGKKWISALTIALAVIFVLITIFTDARYKNEKNVIEWDVISYYAYLPATFIYHDLDLSFVPGYKGPHRFIFWPETAPTGKYVIKTTMGLSFMYLPFFAVGHVAALITGADAGGFSVPYKIALQMGSVIILALGLWYLRKILLLFYSDIITALVIAGFAFGTNLYWYSTYQALMPHVYNFFLAALFLWQTIKWYKNPTALNSLFAGLIIGLISLIRPTNIIILLVFIFFDTYGYTSVKARLVYLSKHYKYIAIMVFAAFLVWVPQIIYWKSMTDHFLFYSYTENERFFFNNPQIINGLFGFRKGLLIYTPIMILAFAGVWYLWRNKSPFALPVTLFLPLNIYIIFSWWCWWYGGSFGSRPFIDSYPLMAVSVAALLQGWLKAKKIMIKALSVTLYILIVSLGIYYHHLYTHLAIHWDSMTKEAFFDSFGRLHPSAEFNSLLKEPDYEKAKEGLED